MEILHRLREEILRQNLNLPQILQKFDRGNQLIYIRDFTEELKTRNIPLKRDDLSFLLAKVKANSLNQINYIEMSNFIMNSSNIQNSSSQFPQNYPQNPQNPSNYPQNSAFPQQNSQNPLNYPQNSQFPQQNPNYPPTPSNYPPNLSNYPQNPSNYPQNPSNYPQNPQNLFETIKEKFKSLYQSQGISLKTLFRQIDLDSDNYLSYKEFSDSLSRKLNFPPLSQNETEAVFQCFDEDRDYKISYFEFSKHILNLEAFDHKKLLQKLKKQLNSEEKDPLKLFKSIDEDKNGDISFIEFGEFLKKLKINFTKSEMEDIFRFFDKDDKEKISYEHFVEVLNEDHLNLSPLREKVQQILKEKGLNLKAFFRSLNTKGEDDFLNKKEFGDFIRKIGFKYDTEQEEEVFETFDQDKDYLISFEEFSNVITEKKQIDLSALMKRLRRWVFAENIDLFAEFEFCDKRNEGFLNFPDFTRILKKNTEFSPVEIEALFTGFSEGKRLDYKAFWEFLLQNNVDLAIIREKFEELRKKWGVDYEGIFQQFDQNKGFLNWLDFDQMVSALQMRIPIEELQEIFNAFDINKDGKLQKGEFIEVLLGKKEKNLRMKFVKEAEVWKRREGEYNKQFVFKEKEGFKRKRPENLNDNGGRLSFGKEKESSFRKNSDSFYDKKERDSGNFYDKKERDSGNFYDKKERDSGNFYDKRKGENSDNFYDKQENSANFNEKKQRENSNFVDKTPEKTASELVDFLYKGAYSRRIDLFSLFTEFDSQQTCILSSKRDLSTIFQQLNIAISPSQIEVLFEYYSPDDGKTMNFVRLLMDCEDPSSILMKMIKYVMKVQRVSLTDVFRNVDQDGDNQWNLKEFSSINSLLNVGMEKNEISRIFDQWNFSKNGYISLKELERIFSEFNDKNEGFSEEKNGGFSREKNSHFSAQKNAGFQQEKNSNFYEENAKNTRFYQQKFMKLKNYLRYILENMREKAVKSFSLFFETTEEMIQRSKFLSILKKIRVNTEKSEAIELCSLLSSESNVNMVNLKEFEYVLRNFDEIFNEEGNSFNENSQFSQQRPMNSDMKAIITELKGIVEEEGFNLFSKFDKNRTGFISEKDLYLALNSILDPCEEMDAFVRFMTKNAKVSLEELKRIFEIEEIQGENDKINPVSMGVKTQYQSSKVLNNSERKTVGEGIRELQRAFIAVYPGFLLDFLLNF